MSQGVQILERKHGYFPVRFKLQQTGQVIKVDAIERCWTEMAAIKGRPRYHFKLRCGPIHYFLSEEDEQSWCTLWSEPTYAANRLKT